MSTSSRPGTTPRELEIAEVALRILDIVILSCGAAMALALVLSFPYGAEFAAGFERRNVVADGARLVVGLRVGLLVGLAMVPLFHHVLTKLAAIVGTVRAGDPFVPDNAVRLRRIAWATLGLQVLGLVFGAVASLYSRDNANIEWSMSVTGWLMVLLLFVLARVFEEGTRMRDDLEGTV